MPNQVAKKHKSKIDTEERYVALKNGSEKY